MPKHHEQPRGNGPRPKDHDRMHTATPHISDGVAAQADYEDTKRIHDVGAYQLASRIPEETPAGGRSGKYQDIGAQYVVPTLEKEKYAFKEQLIAQDSAATGGNSAANWQRTDRDVDIRYDMWKRGQVYDKDRFAMSFVDMREPGNAQWMSTIYPEFMDRRMSEINRKHKIKADLERIKAFGVNTRDDFDLVYNIRAGRIGMTVDGDNATENYQAGWFAKDGRTSSGNVMMAPDFGKLTDKLAAPGTRAGSTLPSSVFMQGGAF